VQWEIRRKIKSCGSSIACNSCQQRSENEKLFRFPSTKRKPKKCGKERRRDQVMGQKKRGENTDSLSGCLGGVKGNGGVRSTEKGDGLLWERKGVKEKTKHGERQGKGGGHQHKRGKGRWDKPRTQPRTEARNWSKNRPRRGRLIFSPNPPRRGFRQGKEKK